jgi:hypothetical protein
MENGNRAKQRQKGIDNNIHIIMPEAKHIEKRKYLNKEVAFYITPIRVLRNKKLHKPAFIGIVKDIRKKSPRIIQQELIFL